MCGPAAGRRGTAGDVEEGCSGATGQKIGKENVRFVNQLSNLRTTVSDRSRRSVAQPWICGTLRKARPAYLNSFALGGPLSSTQAVASSDSRPERPYKRRYRSEIERRRMVEQSLALGANVKDVAKANGVRANQFFKWRRQYRGGRLGPVASETTLLPVRITDAKRKALTKRCWSNKAGPIMDIRS